ncbi:MAG: hypothetical protein M3328_14915, partial [Chloroflexota bacterium]|nr:hypothetical protein [Chloroflexota bacterium]
AYIRFGAAKGTDEPLAPGWTPLGTPVLIVLLPAFGLALWTGFRMVPGQRDMHPVMLLATIALLVLVAGIVHLVVSVRKPAPHEPSLAEAFPGTGSPVTRRLMLPAVLLLVLVRGYAGPVMYDWPFIRGVDLYSHAVMSNLMMTRGEIEPYLIYPPGFHTLVAVISRFSGLDPLEIFPVLAPALLLLAALASYTLARRLWGWPYGVAAALFSGVLLGGTYYYYNDAMYPNLIASQFLLVLAIAALLRLYATPSWRGALVVALVGSSVVFYHQVASLYEAVLLALVVVLFLPYLLAHERAKGLVLLSSLALLGLLSVLYAWDTYDLGRLIAGLVSGSEASTTGTAVGMAVGTQVPYTLDFLVGTMVTQPVAWLGLLGALLVMADLVRRAGTPRVLAHLTLLVWALVLFVGSRTPLTGFPQRFGRDVGVPLAILAALALLTILRSLEPRRRPAAVFVASLVVLLVGSLVGFRTVQSMEDASGPSVQLTITPEIAAAGEWLREHNDGGNIMVSPHANQVPSRMMLAMGGYSALQSFEAGQIMVPRDLPPTGPEPLWDVLWVMGHPDDERTRQLLKKYDVRYIVLYKNMPDRPTFDYWKSFKARPDLYRTTFENDDVLIVTRRDVP